LISPASLAWRWIRVAGMGKAMTSRASSGARRAHAPALVAAASVAVADVLGQDRAQVLFVDDEHPVGAPGPYRTHEALGVGVHPWRLGCNRQRCHPDGHEYRIEGCGKLRILGRSSIKLRGLSCGYAAL